MSQHWLTSQESVHTVGNNFPFLGEPPRRHLLWFLKSERWSAWLSSSQLCPCPTTSHGVLWTIEFLCDLPLLLDFKLFARGSVFPPDVYWSKFLSSVLGVRFLLVLTRTRVPQNWNKVFRIGCLKKRNMLWDNLKGLKDMSRCEIFFDVGIHQTLHGGQN